MYDKNQIEDSLEFVRQIKDLYDSDDSLDTFDPLEDNDTDELFANLAYNMEKEERPWENVLQEAHSTGAGFGSSVADMQELQKKQMEERRLLEQEEARRREAELAEQRRLLEERRRLEQEEAKRREAELAQQKKLAEERRRLEEEQERRRIAEQEEQKRLAQERLRLEEEKERRRLEEQEEQKRLTQERLRLEEEKERRRIAEQEEQRRQEEERKQIEAERRRLQEEQRRQEEERRRLEEERQRLVEERLQRELAEQKRRQEEQARQEAEEQKRRQQMVLAEQKRKQELQAEQERRQAEEAERKRKQELQAEQERRQAEEAEQKRRQQILAEEQRREAELAAEQTRQAEKSAPSPKDAEVIRLQKRAEELQRQAEMASLEARMRQLQLESQTARGESMTPVAPPSSASAASDIPMPMLSIPGMQSGMANTQSAQGGIIEDASAGKRKLSKEEIDNIFAKELKKVPNADSSYQQRKEMLQRQADRLRQKREEASDAFPMEKIREKAVQTKTFVVDFVWKLRDFVQEKTTDPENEESREKAKKILSNLLVVMICIFVAFLLASVVTTFVAHPTKVEGESMETTLTDGDTVIIQKMSYYFGSPERYDVVVFPVYNSDTYYIKRVIGLPGETVQIEEGKVLINGEELEDDTYGKEEYIDDPGDAAEPITLASDEYFVLGDNRNMSTDSRNSYVGVIKKKNIAGKAWKRVLPFSKFGSIKE